MHAELNLSCRWTEAIDLHVIVSLAHRWDWVCRLQLWTNWRSSCLISNYINRQQIDSRHSNWSILQSTRLASLGFGILVSFVYILASILIYWILIFSCNNLWWFIATVDNTIIPKPAKKKEDVAHDLEQQFILRLPPVCLILFITWSWEICGIIVMELWLTHCILVGGNLEYLHGC